MRGAADWLARTALLVLSVMATLSLIGSLASVSGGPLADGVPGRVGPPVELVEEAPPPGAPPAAPDNAADPTAPPDAPVAQPATVPPEDEVARWLKALTYAVLALAGFAAAGLLVLLRITAHLARIADR